MKGIHFVLIMAVLISALILFKCNCGKVEKPEVIPVKEQVKAVEKKEAVFIPKVDSIELEVKIRDKKIEALNKSLKYLQSENKRLGGLALTIDTVYKDIPTTDYLLIQDLVNNAAEADKACNETVTALELQVNSYVNIVSAKDSMYMELRRAFGTAMDQQEICTGYSKKLEKKVKRVQAGRWVWKAVALAGGLFILQSVAK